MVLTSRRLKKVRVELDLLNMSYTIITNFMNWVKSAIQYGITLSAT